MSKKDFQQWVKKNEGYILSDGTLNLTHLLAKAHDFIVNFRIKTPLKKEIASLFKGIENESCILNKVYHSETHILEEKMEEANAIWNEDVFYFLNEIAPNGYSFGSSDGDGALIGWFSYSEEMVG